MRPYTIFIDGISKAYAATGVRVGWAFGPREVIDKMKSILGHVGAWAPKPEQVAVAEFMANSPAMENYMSTFKSEIHKRLTAFYNGFQKLAEEGLPVEAISPEAAIYLAVKVDLRGKRTSDGTTIADVPATTRYMLKEAGLAMVPFSAFGASSDNPWYRLSVGTVHTQDIPVVIEKLRVAINQLN